MGKKSKRRKRAKPHAIKGQAEQDQLALDIANQAVKDWNKSGRFKV